MKWVIGQYEESRVAGEMVNLLVEADILSEVTGKKRDQTFGYSAYLERLRIGTEIE